MNVGCLHGGKQALWVREGSGFLSGMRSCKTCVRALQRVAQSVFRMKGGWMESKKSRQNARRCGRRNDQATGSVNMQTKTHEMPFPFTVVLFQGRRFFCFSV